MNTPTTQASILWRQVWGLSAMLAAILISFKAYELYQPTILTGLGFTTLVSLLGVVQGLLGAIVEPLVGSLSDRILRQFGNRLPQITVGVTIAGLIFVTVALILQNNDLIGIRWLMPPLMGVWLIAMIAVRGPVVAMLRQFAPVEKLPQANAVIILVLGLVGALGPLLELGLRQLGEAPTFVIGTIALLIGTMILFTSTPRHSLTPFIQSKQRPASRQLLSLIFLVGVGASLEMGLMMSVFPKLLNAQVPNIRLEWITAGVLLVSALAANPWEA